MTGIVPGTRVGILGSGQLARMLAEAAFRLGLQPDVYADSSEAPAARSGAQVTLGTVEDPSRLAAFLAPLRVVVFENEFVSGEALAIASRGTDVQFSPNLRALDLLRDKLSQKQVLHRLGIPSAPYDVHSPAESVRTWLERFRRTCASGCVMKWSRLGYDGKGIFVVDADGALPDAAIAFGEEAVRRGIPLFAEERVLYRQELALTAVRSATTEFVTYPLVISRQEDGVCVEVLGPATALGVNPQLAEQARTYARQLAEDLSLCGCFALEFFELSSGELWVNEVAPRVHNSSHYSLDAAVTSQFENHWRAVLGWSLGSVGTSPGFAMRNLLGPVGIYGDATVLELPALSSPLHLHWYGKADIRPGRKLGHVNGITNDATELPALRRELQRYYESWAAGVTRPATPTDRPEPR